MELLRPPVTGVGVAGRLNEALHVGGACWEPSLPLCSLASVSHLHKERLGPWSPRTLLVLPDLRAGLGKSPGAPTPGHLDAWLLPPVEQV